MRWPRLLPLVAVVLLLAGCAVIPTHGPVTAGQKPGAGLGPGITFAPPGPTPGESQKEVVTGFVNAAAGPAKNYHVARLYLAPTFRAKWQPAARVLIHDGVAREVQHGAGAVDYVVPTVASVDSRGVYTATTTSTDDAVGAKSTTVPFTLQKVDGQWRISHTDPGIVLPDTLFGGLFTSDALAWYDPTFARTVPDLRWFPRAAATPRAVVDRLLAGPASPLRAPVTASAFPAGTRVRAVTAGGGVATVDLATSAAVTAQSLARMKVQLVASLQEVQSITRVNLSVDGVSTGSGDVTLPAPSVPDPLPLVARNGVVGSLSGQTVRADPVLGRAIAATGPLAFTASDGLRLAAVRTVNGVEAVPATGKPVVVDPRAALIDPSLDPLGWIWSVPQDDPGAIQVFDAKGKKHDVANDPGDALGVTAMEVSRDGTRMLLLYRTDDGPLAVVAGIERNAAGMPVALTAERWSVAVPGGRGIDATWVDERSVAILTTGSGGDVVTKLELGGPASPLGQLGDATDLVGGPSARYLTARLANRDLATHPLDAWQEIQGAPVQVLGVRR